MKIRAQRDMITDGGYGNVEEKPTIEPVQIVTIKAKHPLFKDGVAAERIEKIELEENGFSLISQKGLYEVGDKAVYIQPDYSLPDTEIFDSFIRPYGDEKKCRLGSNNRIRALKFNLSVEGSIDPVYSVGILLPYSEVYDLLPNQGFSNNKEGNLETTNLTELLGITKWEEPEKVQKGVTNGGRPFPSGIYKTDETNINNLWGHIENKIGYPITLIGTEKCDGSSISIIVEDDIFEVASRSLIKPNFINKVIGHRKLWFFEKWLKFFGYKPSQLIKKYVENDDKFITLAKPYIDKIKEKSGSTNIPDIILRGEANGIGWGGSGNKNNPAKLSDPNIKFFGIDKYEGGVAIKLGEEQFSQLIDVFELERCKVVFNKTFNSRKEIEDECNSYFKDNLIEGIVIRSLDSKFSAKFMSEDYDSKK